MPLAVPGVNVALGDKSEWAQKLVGKKISDSATASDVNTFAKRDLPEGHRVLAPDSLQTLDYRPERLNVLLDEDETVRDVNFG
ncbi:Peptidase inhibitor I78 family [Aspergillus sp. HF37]|nr:Peptidase inhibitor I78 family [Aspergillus sp. HF37]